MLEKYKIDKIKLMKLGDVILMNYYDSYKNVPTSFYKKMLGKSGEQRNT